MSKYRFEMTCGACPEQYDVFDENNNQVAYVRLRHGHLRVDAPDCGDKTIYEYSFPDSWKGCFDDFEEREHYFKIIEEAIDKSHYNPEKF